MDIARVSSYKEFICGGIKGQQLLDFQIGSLLKRKLQYESQTIFSKRKIINGFS